MVHVRVQVCLYPKCQKKFKNRAHLFCHLRRYRPDVIRGYHLHHANLKLSRRDVDSLLESKESGEVPCVTVSVSVRVSVCNSE